MLPAARTIFGYLSGLSSPSVIDIITTPRALAQVEQRGADKVADILDHNERMLS